MLITVLSVHSLSPCGLIGDTLQYFAETKSRGIFTNIHEPKANNCFSIITQVIIEIP